MQHTFVFFFLMLSLSLRGQRQLDIQYAPTPGEPQDTIATIKVIDTYDFYKNHVGLSVISDGGTSGIAGVFRGGEYGGIFRGGRIGATFTGLLSAAVFESEFGHDISLGGSSGSIYATEESGSDLDLFCNDDFNIHLDENNNSNGVFRVQQGTNTLFLISESGGMYTQDNIGLRMVGNRLNLQWDAATGEIGYDNSSRRYKMNIKNLVDNWTKILKVRPVQYARSSSPDHPEYGYIAEEMDSIGLTNLVSYDQQNKPFDVDYERMVIYLTEMVKIQQDHIEKLKEGNRITINLVEKIGQQMADLYKMVYTIQGPKSGD